MEKERKDPVRAPLVLSKRGTSPRAFLQRVQFRNLRSCVFGWLQEPPPFPSGTLTFWLLEGSGWAGPPGPRWGTFLRHFPPRVRSPGSCAWPRYCNMESCHPALPAALRQCEHTWEAPEPALCADTLKPGTGRPVLRWEWEKMTREQGCPGRSELDPRCH